MELLLISSEDAARDRWNWDIDVKDGMPDTKSFQTRVYGKFKDWANEGIIVKVGRGVYKSVD